MTLRILVNGAHGKMGQETVKAIQADDRFELVGQTGKNHNLKAEIKKSQATIVVDFTTPTSVFQNVSDMIACDVHPVIGTTGLKPEQIETLQKQCAEKKLGGIIAPNFSVGAVLMIHFSKMAARFFPDAEIIEMHHPAKLDIPSGTAIKTAAAINKKIPIHSVRLPGIVADQTVLFGGPAETLNISHRTLSRQAFMPGVLLACEKVMTLDYLAYGLEDILFNSH